jgi:hypothetical protein
MPSPWGSAGLLVALGPDGKTALWVRALSTSASQRHAGSELSAFFAWGGTWNRDGTIVFGGPSLRGPLYRVPVAGGTLTPLTRIVRVGSIQTDRWPFFLPDTNHFLYFADSNANWRPSGETAKL